MRAKNLLKEKLLQKKAAKDKKDLADYLNIEKFGQKLIADGVPKQEVIKQVWKKLRDRGLDQYMLVGRGSRHDSVKLHLRKMTRKRRIITFGSSFMEKPEPINPQDY